jgi:AcrR family transcriptional regulator
MMETPKPYHHGNLRQALIHAALDLVAEHGARGFTLREVARKVGVSHNAPYRHFADRERLMAAIAIEGFHKLSESVAEAAAKRTHPMEKLIGGATGYLTFATRFPAHYEVMFGAAGSGEPDPGLIEAGEAAFLLLIDGVRQCQKANVIRFADARQGARLMWSLLHGIASLHNTGRLQLKQTTTIQQFGRTAVLDLINGLKPYKTSFSPNCNCRAEVAVDVIRPALPTGPELEYTVLALGMAKFG